MTASVENQKWLLLAIFELAEQAIEEYQELGHKCITTKVGTWPIESLLAEIRHIREAA